jgi:hypothetical protein
MKFLTLFIYFVLIGNIYAQNYEPEQILVPLSKPGKPGYLFINHKSGSISVTGYNGDVVIIYSSLRSGKIRQKDKNKVIKTVINSPTGITATEKENTITVSTTIPDRTVDLEIRVPISFSMNLSTVDNGKIEIRNISGEMEINNNGGDINLFDVSGSAVLSTIDGNIFVKFKKVTPDVPMAFSSISGKIDITFPPQIRATLKMKSNEGELNSEFDIDFDKRKTKTEKNEMTGLTKFFIEDWLIGKINGGGPEIMIKNTYRDIFIRKGK